MNSPVGRAAALALLLSLLAQPVYASGPGTGGRTTELQDQPAGPYLVSVFSSPAPPVTESLYLEIRVKETESGRVIAGGTVFARADPVDFQADSVSGEATHDIAPLEIDFAVHLPLPAPGIWQITIDIDGPFGSASLSFPLLVNRSSQGSPLTLPVGFLVALLVGVGVWAARRRSVAGGELTASG